MNYYDILWSARNEVFWLIHLGDRMEALKAVERYKTIRRLGDYK